MVINLIDWQTIIDKCCESQPKHSRELKDNEFTASMLAGCLRQATINKLELVKHDSQTYRMFKVGSMIHRFIQQECSLGFINKPVEFEKEVLFEHDGIKIYGHVDCYDGKDVYDFKTTSDIKRSERLDIHVGYAYQLSSYLHALNARKAYLIYIAKNDMSVINKEVITINKQTLSSFCHNVLEAVDVYTETKILPSKCKCFICIRESIK